MSKLLTPRKGEALHHPVRAAKRRHVVTILPRGEAVRNFVYTGTLDALAAFVDLTILTVVPNERIRQLLQERFERVIPLEVTLDPWPPRLLRELLETAHARWLWSVAAQQRWMFRDLEASDAGKKTKRWVKKLLSRPFANRAGLRLLGRAERLVTRVLNNSGVYRTLFRRLDPDLVFNASHVHAPAAIGPIQAAQWLGIPTATFIFSWDNLTSQGRVIPPYDHYLVWNHQIRQQLLRLYDEVTSHQVLVTGTPQFDPHFRPDNHWPRHDFCARVGADPSRPIVLYSTGMDNHIPGEPQIVEQVADMIAQMTDLGPPQLLVRIYPKERSNRFEDLKHRRRDILFPSVPWDRRWLTPEPEDTQLLTNTLRHAAVGINAASTISLELCMLDVPVINVAYDPPGVDIRPASYASFYRFEHYRPVAESGAVALAHSDAEMRHLLREALTMPSKRRREREQLVQAMFGETLDGHSSMRVAEALCSLATAPHPRG